jgi:O-antigen/teichoic acid export membrane protein
LKIQTRSASGRGETVLVLADQILVSGVNFLTGIILARFLGLDGYGQYVLAFGTILFLSGSQIALIVSPMMVRGPVLKGHEAQSYYHAVLVTQIAFSVCSAAAIFLLTHVLFTFSPSWTLWHLAPPLSCVAFLFSMQDFTRRYLFSINRAYSVLMADLCSYGMRLLLLLLLGLNAGLSPSWALWIIAGASAIGLLFSLTQCSEITLLVFPDHEVLKSTLTAHWHFGKWLLANNIAYWCGSQFTIYLAAAVLSITAVGAMSATLSLVGVVNILYLALENLAPSRASQIFASKGKGGLDRYLRRLSVLGGLFTLAVLFGAGLPGEYWMELIYGPSYQGYGWMIWWWGCYYLLGFFQRPQTIGHRVLGNTRAIFRGSLYGAIGAVLLSYPAVQMYGIVGAMLTLVAAQLITFCYLTGSYLRITTTISGDTLPTRHKTMEPITKEILDV